MTVTLRQKIGFRYGLWIAWIFSTIASLASFYMSEKLHWVPCNLCWFQRSIMFSLVYLLGQAAWLGDHKFTGYGMLMTGTGMTLSFFHVLKLHLPSLQEVGCKVGVSCSKDRLIEWTGIPWLSIPLLTLLGFFFLLVILTVTRSAYAKSL